MVEVFKTNVQEIDVAEILIKKLYFLLPFTRINFDLSDCDKILRVEGENVSIEKITELVKSNGYQAELLS